MKLHPSITYERVLAEFTLWLYDLPYSGICANCGESAAHIAHDARQVVCGSCKQPAVYGCEELITEV